MITDPPPLCPIGKIHPFSKVAVTLEPVMRMQNTALSFTERSGHCGATSSHHWSWHSLATSEGDNVISYNVWREQELWSISTSVGVTPLMSFCWCHSVDALMNVTLLMSLYLRQNVDFTLLISLWKYQPVDVTLLVSIYWCHSVNVNMLMSLY